MVYGLEKVLLRESFGQNAVHGGVLANDVLIPE